MIRTDSKEYFELGLVPNSTNDELKVMSYNILADHYTHKHLYPYADESVLDFEYRSHRVINEIQASNSDVILLQVHNFLNATGSRQLF